MRLLVLLLACLLASPAWANPKEIARLQRAAERGDADSMKVLVMLHPTAAAPILAGVLRQRDPRTRRAAASAMWDLARGKGHAELVRRESAALEAALSDPDPSTVVNAAGALQTLGWSNESLADARRGVLFAADASGWARFMAARGLIGIEPAEALMPALLDYLFANVPENNDGRPSNLSGGAAQRAAHQAIERQIKADPDASLPFLLQAMDSAHPAVASLMVLAHPARAGIPEWTSRLLGLSHSPHPGISSRAWKLLGEMRTPDEAARWVPEAARRLEPGSDAPLIVSALATQAGASSAANEVLADLAADSDSDRKLRLSALDALEKAASDIHSKASADGKASARGAGLRAASAILREPGPDDELIRAAIYAARSFEPDRAERGRWYAQRTLTAARGTQPALLDAVQSTGRDGRGALDLLRPLLDSADAELRTHLEATLSAIDPAWQARERRAAIPLPPEQRVTPPPAPKPVVAVEHDPRPAPRTGAARGSFPRYYEAIRQGDIKAFQRELDAGLAINEAHQLAAVAQFRITPLQAVVDYCHITQLVSTETLVEMARILLQRGADPGLSGSRDRSALESAFDSQCPEALQEVLQTGG